MYIPSSANYIYMRSSADQGLSSVYIRYGINFEFKNHVIQKPDDWNMDDGEWNTFISNNLDVDTINDKAYVRPNVDYTLHPGEWIQVYKLYSGVAQPTISTYMEGTTFKYVPPEEEGQEEFGDRYIECNLYNEQPEYYKNIPPLAIPYAKIISTTDSSGVKVWVNINNNSPTVFFKTRCPCYIYVLLNSTIPTYAYTTYKKMSQVAINL